ncbi:MAG: hypothetical protein Q4B86_01165 [Eubacteriales bacterium]|nr:hypothetical protein [Eubacteriales bacterium]
MKKYLSRENVTELLILAVIVFFAFFINRDIEIKGLYMDDLYMWSCYGEQSLLEFAFPIGTSTRFRPVYWLMTYLQMAIIGNHISWFVPFNIICNIIVAFTVYFIGKAIVKNRFLSLAASLCYLSSRFAYYQIGQALGLMETMAIFMALIILYLLYKYMNMDNLETFKEVRDSSVKTENSRLEILFRNPGEIYYFGALIIYFLLVFVHERYLSLLPLFYLTLIVKLLRHKKEYKKEYLKENIRLWVAPVITFVVIFIIRKLAIGSAIPAGTGGTEVTETFNIKDAIGYALDQVMYIFGVNAGPEHLCGLPWDMSPVFIKYLTKLSVLALFIICGMYAVTMLLDLGSKEEGAKARFCRNLSNSLLFVGFIALCIACSSVTIRVEMRWIYVSYTAALLFALYMIREICDIYMKISADEAEKYKDSENADALKNLNEAERQLYEKEKAGNVFRRSSLMVTEKWMSPKIISAIIGGIFIFYCVLSISTNAFYRQYYPKLYFWPDQLRMNSLAEETVESHGTEYVIGKDIYILENTYNMSQFYADTFFKTFDKEKKAEGTKVHFINNLNEIPVSKRNTEDIIIIREIPERNAYENITEKVKEANM